MSTVSTKCEIAILQHQYTRTRTHARARAHTNNIWGCVCSFIGKDIQVFLVLQNKCFLFLNLLKPPLPNTHTHTHTDGIQLFSPLSLFIYFFKVVVFASFAFFMWGVGGKQTNKQTNLNCQNNFVVNFSREEGRLLCGKIKSSMWENQKAPHPYLPPRVETSELLKTIKHRRDLF